MEYKVINSDVTCLTVRQDTDSHFRGKGGLDACDSLRFGCVRTC